MVFHFNHNRTNMTFFDRLLRFVQKNRIGKSLLIKAALTLTPIMDFFYPKDKSVIIFGSDGGMRMSGDPKALFLNIKKKFPDYNLYFYIKKPTNAGHVKMHTLSSLFLFLRARYAVSSTGISDFGYFRWSRRKKVIATWHAISMKSCGHAQRKRTRWDKISTEKYSNAVTAAIASSKYDAAISCLMFGYGGRIYLTGHPRNDHLLTHKGSDKNVLRDFIPTLSGDEYVILYAPTFRDAAMSSASKQVRTFPFADYESSELHSFLKRNNAILLLRKHVADLATHFELESENVIDFNHEICPDVNDVLVDVDLLITDYSSICYDFLLLNRPVMFIPYDLEEYENNRGLIIDNYDFWTPGPKISTFKEFIQHTNNFIVGQSDSYDSARIELNKVLNSHQTCDSTSRFLHLLKILERET